ncbi:MAG: hypothetical protein JJ894_03210 [Dinoroseobacter sp.]|nr:hypothetical protein [Dinoroseobacter sp.]
MTQIDLSPLPPREAIDFFRSKGLAPALNRFDWRDHWREEHARAFVVAKAMQDDLLQTIRVAVDRAIAEGTTLEQFRDELEPKLRAAGWWGREKRVDPLTGEEISVQLGSRHRLKVIFDTNLRTSYAAGRWQRIWRTRAAFPYLEYRQIDRPTKRHDHTRYHGLIRPVEDPIWAEIFPPNGWFCGCTVVQHTARSLEREGKQVSEPLELELETYENRRTGRTEELPVGVHPGFDTNPGRIWTDLRAAHARASTWLPQTHSALDRALIEEVRTRGIRDRDESLVYYDLNAEPEGAIIGWNRSVAGRPNSVGATPAMAEAMTDSKRSLVAIHDHPSSGSFSPTDVNTLLRFPGLTEVVAVGLDGSIYRMRAGTQAADARVAYRAIQDILEIEVKAGSLNRLEANRISAHFFAMALDTMGVIEYRHALSGIRLDLATKLGPMMRNWLDEL